MLERLIAQADVFITNMPLPARERLRMRYADFAETYPRLIYASLTAYGEAGEEAGKTGFDPTAYWARSGLMDEVRTDHRAHAGSLGGRDGRSADGDGAVRRDRDGAVSAGEDRASAARSGPR